MRRAAAVGRGRARQRPPAGPLDVVEGSLTSRAVGHQQAALRSHRKAQATEQLEWGAAYVDEGLVFCLENGTALHPDAATEKRFMRHVEAAGLPWIGLHGLRHTHATLMLQARMHPKVVQERLGHSSIAITMDTYSHAVPAMLVDADRSW